MVARCEVVIVPFDTFNFGSQYTWSLAFYKLCALKFIAENIRADNYCYLDSDVFVQGSLCGAFAESKHFILMPYLLMNHPAQGHSKRGQEIIQLGYMTDLDPSPINIGGEFFAANRQNTHLFIKECEQIFNSMVACDFRVDSGDEFISTIAMMRLQNIARSANGYIGRFYTRVFRLIPERWRYHPLPVLHVPGEKEHGMLSVYRRYVRNGTLPAPNKAYRMLHIQCPSFKTRLARIYFFILVKLGKRKNPWVR